MNDILVTEYRGILDENDIRGRYCIVSEDGSVLHSLGDISRHHYYRSSAKPIQALPILYYGIKDKFGFTDREYSVFCASHLGESFHIEAITSALNKIGLTDEDMILPPTYPGHRESAYKLISEGKPMRKIYYNCSGKHTALLAFCLHLGCDYKDYWKPESPIQKDIKKFISVMSEYPAEDVIVGADGCGVPVFAVPLYNVAMSYLNLACPDRLKNEKLAECVRYGTACMNANPEMVSGTKQLCSILLEDENIVAKGGACALYCIGLRRERLGIAIKLESGAAEYMPYIVISMLEQLGYSNKATIEKLKKTYPEDYVNPVGVTAYTRKCRFTL
ncbi:MAG: asparaginase [Clostridiales bacterium]|nr:asparaginase [Clostridiales bacterium]